MRYEVTEHQCYAGCCQRCGQHHKAHLPDAVPAGQMGPGLIAWINLINGRYHLTLRQIESLLQEQWGLTFSLGAISQSQKKLNDWLAPSINKSVKRFVPRISAMPMKPDTTGIAAPTGSGPYPPTRPPTF
ncbi:hypothetical protein [methane-oxidizing endosymbiont of Gigantopelta aegis]|uniref:hypothetical protein n=1 Tax=methane-oxidizing endosymbiont of Gigantopelta aegis TaxID=2794938 RepID=UPI001FD9FC51|nr:hypothetical protein [methane-oxidizing endosymbiont of Gigantopelta aegis]